MLTSWMKKYRYSRPSCALDLMVGSERLTNLLGERGRAENRKQEDPGSQLGEPRQSEELVK